MSRASSPPAARPGEGRLSEEVIPDARTLRDGSVQGGRRSAAVAVPPRDLPLLPSLAARVVGTTALGGFGALHWAGQVEPAASGPMLGMVVFAVGGGLLVHAAAALPRAARAGALAAVALSLALAVFLAAGIPARLLVPAAWGELGDQIASAITTLPSIRVPYAGVDDTLRSTILLGGTLLLAIGAVGALWPGGRGASRALAVVALALLYAVPATEMDLPGQFGRGFAFGALLAGFLLLERVRARTAVAAAAVAATALLAGLLAATALDRDAPPLDYEQLAGSLESQGDPRFDWGHSYGPIDWSRDGREVMRVRAERSAYWKAENLAGFNGRVWQRTRLLDAQGSQAELPAADRRRPGWIQDVRVRITGMRTRQVIGAGTTLAVSRAPRRTLSSSSAGSYVVGGELERGDSYFARVYVPSPTAEELETAGVDYGPGLDAYRTLEIPSSAPGGRPSIPVTYPAFGEPASTQPLALEPSGLATRAGARITAASAYGRAWELAERMRDRAANPYEFVRAVEAHFRRGFRYTETPPAGPFPLDSFLFGDRAGYCQHFSGAMALLLRMGGVPARIAAGFAPGTLDRRRGEYVVRDLDAHSWVEAWFPGYGWVPFDPTPSEAPAASQASAAEVPSAATPSPGERPDPGLRLREGEGGGVSPWLPVGGSLLLALAFAGGFVLVRAARRPRGEDPLLSELERALRRTGRPPVPGTTLRALEGRFAGSPQAAGYLRALREARYGHGEGPRPAQRSALRRELARGLGPAGRLRAAWALPPRRRPRRGHRGS